MLACLSVNSFSGGVSYVTVISPSSSSSSSSPLSSSTQLQPLPLPSTNLLISRSNSVSSKYPATTVDFLCLSLRESFVPCSVRSLLAPLIGSRLLYHIIIIISAATTAQLQPAPVILSASNILRRRRYHCVLVSLLGLGYINEGLTGRDNSKGPFRSYIRYGGPVRNRQLNHIGYLLGRFLYLLSYKGGLVRRFLSPT